MTEPILYWMLDAIEGTKIINKAKDASDTLNRTTHGNLTVVLDSLAARVPAR